MWENKIRKIYEILFKRFGEQHWWPGETDFEIIVGAILTQGTNWKNVEKSINNIKERGLLELEKFKNLSIEEIRELIKPSGFFNVKAKRLKNFLNEFSRRFRSIDEMKTMERDELRKYLLSIKGIGKETADSIILYALKKPIFVVDAYTRRILVRHNIIKGDEDYEYIRRLFEDNLPDDEKLFNEYHALLVKLGKEYCLKKKPLCSECPLNNI
uniref:Endonuclease III domain-containing protein n=1 Tax=candidate division WOR-3 bacterium TaxID=2052148 RepID=A0A7C4U7X3_UNCW3